MIDQSHLEELKQACGDVSVVTEGGVDLVLIPRLVLPEGCPPRETSALLCTGQHGGYSTRLFLATMIRGMVSRITLSGNRFHTLLGPLAEGRFDRAATRRAA